MLRMNDIHDAWTPEFLSDWKREDPTRVMSTLDKAKDFNVRQRLWSLVDFEHPDVEPRLGEIVQDVAVILDAEQNIPETEWRRFGYGTCVCDVYRIDCLVEVRA